MKNDNDDKLINPAELDVIKELGTLADDIINDMPEPSESAISAHDAQTAEQSAPVIDVTRPDQKSNVAVDLDGNSFNPDVHKSDADGKPTLSAKGNLIKKPGRKKGGTNRQPRQSTIGNRDKSSVSSGELLDEAQRQRAAVTGNVSASMLITVSMMIGGKEFAPAVDAQTGIDEKLALSTAFTDYYIATGRTDLPPNVALLATVAMYILPRFTHDTVRARFKEKTTGIRAWWKNRKNSIGAKKNGPQSNPGNDGKRKNDTGETISAGLQI